MSIKTRRINFSKQKVFYIHYLAKKPDVFLMRMLYKFTLLHIIRADIFLEAYRHTENNITDYLRILYRHTLNRTVCDES